MTTTREQFHAMVDAARHALWTLTIPEDDEPVTDEDREAIRAGREAYARGEYVTNDELKRRLGLW